MMHLGAMRLKDVRPVNVSDVMTAVSPMSESSQQKVLNTLRQLFRTACQNGLIMKNPAEDAKITKHNKPEKKKYLTRQEQEALMKSIESIDPRARCFVALCLYCGLRREEALGLQWGDMEQGFLTVNRANSFVNNNHVEESQELKSSAAHRKIKIPVKLQEILDVTPRKGLYVITCAKSGENMTQGAFKRLWAKVKAVSPCEVYPHMLRHSYATNLYYAGIKLKKAQYLLGHSNIQMTANIYTHLEEQESAADLVLLDDYLKRTENSESSQKVVKAQF